MMETTRQLIKKRRMMQMVYWPEYHPHNESKNLFLEQMGDRIRKQLEAEMYCGLVRP